MLRMSRLRRSSVDPIVLLIALGCGGGAHAGPVLDALDGRWTPTHCDDPATGTWTVFGNKIQFFWPTDRGNDALEEVTREDEITVETVVVSPDRMKGWRYRYSIVGDQVLIENLNDGTQQIVRKCD